MGMFDKLRKQAQTAVDKHGDKIADGIDKAAGAADRKTKGKHQGKLQGGARKAREAIDKQRGDQPPGGGPGPGR